MRCVLVGDIGGTRSLLELFAQRDGRLFAVHAQSYRSEAYPDFEALLDDFFSPEAVKREAHRVDAACFSVAGSVEAQASTLTNLNWRVDARAISARFGIADVRLVNDFAAAGYGISDLGVDDIVTLQGGELHPHSTRVIVGAGTGLGVCTLTWQGDCFAVHASEAGHTDFAPINDAQDILLQSLRRAFGRVSYERVVSGPGLLRIFSVLQDSDAGQASKQLIEAMQRGDAPAAISEFAIGKLDPLAVRALDLFVEIYGAFTGNMALMSLSRGGVYLAGGIARKIIAKLSDGTFVRAFSDKGRFSDLLRRYPIHIVTDPRIGIKGALRLVHDEQRV